jgi:hypothetical protein
MTIDEAGTLKEIKQTESPFSIHRHTLERILVFLYETFK